MVPKSEWSRQLTRVHNWEVTRDYTLQNHSRVFFLWRMRPSFTRRHCSGLLEQWSQAKFQRYCSHCSKWGHKRADCRIRLVQHKNGAVAGVQEPESEAERVKAAQWSDVDSEDVDMDSSSWCFAALNNPKGRTSTLLVDSGADEERSPQQTQRGSHGCVHKWVRHVPIFCTS